MPLTKNTILYKLQFLNLRMSFFLEPFSLLPLKICSIFSFQYLTEIYLIVLKCLQDFYLFFCHQPFFLFRLRTIIPKASFPAPNHLRTSIYRGLSFYYYCFLQLLLCATNINPALEIHTKGKSYLHSFWLGYNTMQSIIKENGGGNDEGKWNQIYSLNILILAMFKKLKTRFR